MKKYKNLVKLSMLTAIVAMLASCEQKEVEPTTNQEDANLITYENLEVKLPEGIEEGVLSMELADLQNRFYELNPAMKLKAAAGNMEISLTEMDELVSAILSKYPNTFDLSEEDRSMIKEDFVKVDDHMIVEHREVIEKYYSAIIKYELINVLAEYQPKSSGGDDYLGTGLNQKEFWLLAGNPGMVGPTKDASYKAIDLTKKYYPTGSHYRNKADAFRHAIWNALIAKYVGKKKNTVSKCT
ncbi:MAG: hypothetical protein MI922_27655, partial [Bacteroidales bacterium]|nr:hypothetical protein [Bacteroidales bacterium]